ncbi:hypothetical protein Pmani_019322 [Petrolisthes manimaculis]|uniref:ETS domain-containing protein n=1 Tax=Petrolisthes manimaculis TaxID=1843537 RepID=A0AAE1U7U5_9EUCA|nr:hypothetical protein Pmani_019322 [Petrolisthes manimaculis]
MQLEQILSAAVAAVNVEEVTQLLPSSPDLPQQSPTPPAPALLHPQLHHENILPSDSVEFQTEDYGGTTNENEVYPSDTGTYHDVSKGTSYQTVVQGGSYHSGGYHATNIVHGFPVVGEDGDNYQHFDLIQNLGGSCEGEGQVQLYNDNHYTPDDDVQGDTYHGKHYKETQVDGYYGKDSVTGYHVPESKNYQVTKEVYHGSDGKVHSGGVEGEGYNPTQQNYPGTEIKDFHETHRNGYLRTEDGNSYCNTDDKGYPRTEGEGHRKDSEEGYHHEESYTSTEDKVCVGEGLGDMSFFSLDESSLVITSQQALQMFDSPSPQPPNTSIPHHQGPTYHALTSAHPPPLDTPPHLPRTPTPQHQSPTYHALTSAHPPPVDTPPILHLPEESSAPYSLPSVQVVEEVVVPELSGEVEVFTSPEPRHYTSLTPAAPQTQPHLQPQDLETTVDADGRFVVKVVAPGVNLAVHNDYLRHHLPQPGTPPQPQPPLQSQEVEVISSPPSPPTPHCDVLTALRESIFRSRARRRGPTQDHEAATPAKRRRQHSMSPSAPLCSPPPAPAPAPALHNVPIPLHLGKDVVTMQPLSAEGEGTVSGEGGEQGDVQVQLVYLVYPMEGNQNRPTLLSPDMHLQYAGHSPTLLGQPEPPSAVSKTWHHTNEECVFDKKEISEWEYKDFVQFVFSANEHLGLDNSTFDFDFSKVSNALPPLRLEETLFKQISKNHGEVLYRYFQSFLDRKREREAQAQQAKFCSQNRISSSGYTVASEGSTHHPSLQDTSVTMDTPARYEIHYKTIEDKRIGYDTNGMMGLSQNMTMPSAALKSFPSMLPQSSIVNQNGTMNPEHSTHEEVKPEVPKKRGPGRPRKPESERKNKKKKTGRLWEFIRNLLLDPSTCPSLVRWENAEEGMFRFIQAEKVAQRWGDRKKNGDMNYEKLSRAMRYYYKTQIFEAVLGRRLVYKFGKNAKNWRPTNPSDPNFQEYHQQYQAG